MQKRQKMSAQYAVTVIIWEYVCVYVYVCIYVCMYVRTCMYECTYVCMYICIYVCVCVCVYVCDGCVCVCVCVCVVCVCVTICDWMYVCMPELFCMYVCLALIYKCARVFGYLRKVCLCVCVCVCLSVCVYMWIEAKERYLNDRSFHFCCFIGGSAMRLYRLNVNLKFVVLTLFYNSLFLNSFNITCKSYRSGSLSFSKMFIKIVKFGGFPIVSIGTYRWSIRYQVSWAMFELLNKYDTKQFTTVSPLHFDIAIKWGIVANAVSDTCKSAD